MSRRRGASLVEALAALLLGLFVVHLGLSTIQRLKRHQDRAARRLDGLLAARVARTVLRAELARGRPGTDWSVGPDSIALRAFRGTGVVCSVGPGPGELAVAWAGDRLPAPAKDSVEVVGAAGDVTVLDLASTAPAAGACPGRSAREASMAWRLDGPIPGEAVLVRVFERGSYHLTGSALRYRIGAGGRQPLTPEVWRDAGTELRVADSAAVLRLEPRPGFGPARAAFLAWVER